MAFSSVHEMIDLCKESGKPLYEVILESDLAESGLTRAESEAEMHRLWAVMQATSDGYCGADRSMSGFAGGDAAKVNAAAARGVLYADGYFADVMAEALKTAECNACMKRIVAAPTAGSCGVLPAVLLPLQRRGLADEAAVHRALYIAAGFGQVVAARATLAGAEGGCQAEVARPAAWPPRRWWTSRAARQSSAPRRSPWRLPTLRALSATPWQVLWRFPASSATSSVP